MPGDEDPAYPDAAEIFGAGTESRWRSPAIGRLERQSVFEPMTSARKLNSASAPERHKGLMWLGAKTGGAVSMV